MYIYVYIRIHIGVGLALGGYALGGRPAVAGADSAVAGANSAIGAAASIKDLMQAAEKEREAKKAAQVSGLVRGRGFV